jgi:uncharacterized OB-fold protein
MGRAMSLRRSVAGERKKKGGKGWGGSWRDRFDMPKADGTDIMLCPGEYADERPESIKENGGEPPMKPYHVHPNHTIKDKNLFRKVRCGGGWEDKDGDCICCYRKTAGDKRIGPKRDVYSLNLLHLALYEKAPLKDAKGKTRKFEHDDPDGKYKRGDIIMSWQQITRARDMKDALKNLDQGLEDGTLAMFRKKYIEVGSAHLQNLMVIDDMARSRCTCGGHLEPTAFFCEKCEEELCNVDDANMTPEERDEYALERQRCNNCGHFGFPELEYVCDECGEPEPLTAFDVVATVRKTGEGTASTIHVEKVVPIYEYEFPDGSGLVKVDDDGELVEDADGELVFEDDIAKLRDNQFDFDKVHQPVDNEYIANLLGVDNPFGSKGGARRYGKAGDRFNSGDSDDDDDSDDDSSGNDAGGGRRRPRGRGRVRRR